MEKHHIEEFYGIEKLDLYKGIILFITTKEGGSFFTSIPISPPEHRKQHPTKYSLTWKQRGCYCVFSIIDDYGHLEIIEVMEVKKNKPFIEENKKYAKLLAEGKLI